MRSTCVLRHQKGESLHHADGVRTHVVNGNVRALGGRGEGKWGYRSDICRRCQRKISIDIFTFHLQPEPWNVGRCDGSICRSKCWQGGQRTNWLGLTAFEITLDAQWPWELQIYLIWKKCRFCFESEIQAFALIALCSVNALYESSAFNV